MKTKALPTQEYLHECFEVRSDGLYWKKRPNSHFKSGVAKASNAKLVGTRVIGRSQGAGYKGVRLNRISYYLHRISYKMYYGVEPPLIDHIDQNRTNNHPSNLRAATHSLNKFNRGKQSNNTSGYKGVTAGTGNNWIAQTRYQNKRIYIGSYATPELAYVAYLNKQNELAGSFAHGG